MSSKKIIWSMILVVVIIVSLQLSSFRRVDLEVWLFFILLFVIFVVFIAVFLFFSYLYGKFFNKEKDHKDF